jgi:high-affinity nickel-transport protein
MTRRLLADGQRPTTVGTFFSLGHSTIVIITCVVVAATASEFSSHFDDFEKVGGVIGTSVSAAFLIVLSIMNVYILYKLVIQLRSIVYDGPLTGEEQEPWIGAGWLTTIFKRLFKFIDRCVDTPCFTTTAEFQTLKSILGPGRCTLSESYSG